MQGGAQDKDSGTPIRYLAKAISWNACNQCYYHAGRRIAAVSSQIGSCHRAASSTALQVCSLLLRNAVAFMACIKYVHHVACSLIE